MRKKNRIRNAIAVGIVLIFVCGAFAPAVGLQSMTTTSSSDMSVNNESVQLGTEQSAQDSTPIMVDEDRSLNPSPEIHSDLSDSYQEVPLQNLMRSMTWYNPSFSYCKNLTINHTKVVTNSSGYLTNFPILLDITDTDLATKVQSTGNDIIFTDISNHKLNHEIEYYNNGHLIAWVNVTNLSSTTDTVIQMFYGNGTIGNQANPTGVWDAHYMMVQHLSETSGTHYDSTSNDNDGTPYNFTGIPNNSTTNTTGKIDGADWFDGINDNIKVPHKNTLAGFTVGMTASAWVKFNRTTARKAIVGKYAIATPQRSWNFEYMNSPISLQFTASKDGAASPAASIWNAAFTPTAGTWYYITVGWNASKRPTFYVNGKKISITASSGPGNVTQLYNNVNTPLFIGRTYTTDRFWAGPIDEVCVSNINRSAEWINTSYNNQVNPSGFITVGPEVSQISITHPSPGDNTLEIPTTISSLSFNITHELGKPMHYTVETSPDIGSADVTGMTNGTYFVSIAGLEKNTNYIWYVNLTAGTLTKRVVYHFKTEKVWLNANWNNRLFITIDHTKVAGTLNNFPVLVDITNESLALNAQTNGNDFVFTDDSGTVLHHEIELYTSSTGHLIAWVNITDLSADEDTIILLYYGNPTVENQQDLTGVWDSHYMMVQHLSETSGTHYDSTVNDNDGTPFGGVIQGAIGQIDGADEFDGSNDYVQVAHDDTLSGFTEGMTASAWVKFDTTIARRAIVGKYDSSGNQRAWSLEYIISPSTALQLTASSNGSAVYSYWSANVGISLNGHLVLCYSRMAPQ